MLSIVNYARDAGLWEEWRDCYHPDATLTTSWFSGTRDEFVDAAKKMKIARHPGESQKHTVTNPWVRLSGAYAPWPSTILSSTREDSLKGWSSISLLGAASSPSSRNETAHGASGSAPTSTRKTGWTPTNRTKCLASFYASIDLSGYPSGHPLPLLAKCENRPPAC